MYAPMIPSPTNPTFSTIDLLFGKTCLFEKVIYILERLYEAPGRYPHLILDEGAFPVHRMMCLARTTRFSFPLSDTMIAVVRVPVTTASLDRQCQLDV